MDKEARTYNEETLLMISGIQHYYFCKRQWQLIHREQLWRENVYTVAGNILHEKVDDPTLVEKRKDIIVSRSMPLVTYRLGFYGVSDAVEFIKSQNGCKLKGRDDFYNVHPIEYKSGKPKMDACDSVQLCVQAFALEEMFQCHIDEGYLFYGKVRRREKILFSDTLRREVIDLSNQMHHLFDSDIIIKPEYSKKCHNCSLYNDCVPKINSGYISVSNYIHASLKEDDSH